MLKVLHNVRLALDTETNDIYAVDGTGVAYKLTDAPKLVGIAVSTPPTKVEYTVGETFDPTGMVISATYDDGSVNPVQGYTCAPAGALALTDTKVTITYRGKTADQAITVTEPTPGPEPEPGSNEEV